MENVLFKGLVQVIVDKNVSFETDANILHNGIVSIENASRLDLLSDIVYGSNGLNLKILFKNKSEEFPCFFSNDVNIVAICPGVLLPKDFEENMQDLIESVSDNELKLLGLEKEVWNNYLTKKPDVNTLPKL